MSQTLMQLHMEGSKRLEEAGVTEAALDARYLLMEAFHLDNAGWLLKRNQTIDADQAGAVEQYNQFISCRAKRIPLQYLLGVQEFMGLEFFVNEHVLVPRQDTESLVELILEEQKDAKIRVLDLCTGSGCIAASLAVLGGYEQVIGCDLSEEALCVARKNACKLGAEKEKLFFLQGDLFDALNGLPVHEQSFNVIVSNPPYIPTEVIKGLEPEVRSFEPFMALDGMEDGLHFYRRLAKESMSYLTPGGSLYLEIGFDQGRAVAQYLEEAGFDQVEIVKDLPGNDRIVKGIKRDV